MNRGVTEAMVEAACKAQWQAERNGKNQHDAMEAALTAALAAEPGAAEGWEPIETAPKDGTRFLAYERGRYFDCWWHENGYGEAYWMDEADCEPNPSDWRPLPAAPHQSGESGNG